ncbi:tRNA modification GTPase [Roseiconus lacunae]|uniref:tRNA modification GTPase n=1 Tax=Roseiconus lacunae TaxID=2605694 RepID=UPI00308BDCEA|nr:tRNA modification GTPase [Stieleria sp. HD01]
MMGVVEVGETIVAIATPSTPAVRGAIRMSGSEAIAIVRRLGIEPTNHVRPHCVDDQVDLGEPLGRVPVRALLWPTARSYTGQPSVELHTYGSLPILQSLVDASIAVGARAARPGEFTMRAFLAGRLDLAQAEAVLGVIDAESRGALDHALRQLAGNLSKPIERLRGELLDLLADVEAGLDFVDEDIQFIEDDQLTARLTLMAESLSKTREQLELRREDKSNWTLALRGLPNAGKSSLINAMAGRDAAIVTDVAGTTRDVVAITMQIGDFDVTFADTAGLEFVEGDSPEDQIMRVAQSLGGRAGHDADIRLWCVDVNHRDFIVHADQMRRLANEKRRSSIDLWVATKCDDPACLVEPPWIATSVKTGRGLETLRQSIERLLEQVSGNDSASVVGTAARCRGSLLAAEQAIEAAIGFVRGGDGHEYVSSELRLAASFLGEVTGAVYTDDILDRVFSRFCIGK